MGIRDLMDAVADGNNVSTPKPAPDVFLKAAELLGIPPAFCAVVEDAEAGIDAALAAGMWAIGLGPAARVGHAHARFDSLQGVTLAALRAALEAASWTVVENQFDPAGQHHMETVFTSGNGAMCLRGAFEEGYPGDMPACFMHRVWDDMPVNFTELANLPEWWGVDADGRRRALPAGSRARCSAYRRSLDLRTGVLSRQVRWQPGPTGPVLDLHFERFTSLVDPHLAAVKLEVSVVSGEADLLFRTGLNAHVENTGLVHWDAVDQDVNADSLMLHVRTRATRIDVAVVAAVNLLLPDDAGLSRRTRRGSAATLCDVEGQPMLERSAPPGRGRPVRAAQVRSDRAEHRCRRSGRRSPGRKRWPGPVEGYAALARKRTTRLGAELWETADVRGRGRSTRPSSRCASTSSSCSSPPRASPTAPPSAPRRSAASATAITSSGTPKSSCCRSSPSPSPSWRGTCSCTAGTTCPRRAREGPRNGYEGAQFPWESAGDGREVTPTWVPHFADPTTLVRIWTGDIEIHITADIAYAVMQFWRATGDDGWMAQYGAEIVLDGASFWASAAKLEGRRQVSLPQRDRAGRVPRPHRRQRLHQLHGPLAPADCAPRCSSGCAARTLSQAVRLTSTLDLSEANASASGAT